jgi:uncharacterized protein
VTGAILAGVLTTSFLGSLHCAGMCGPFVAVYAGLDARPGSRWLAHAAYHAGRLLTYAALGAVAGGLGSALDLAGSAAGIGRVSAIVAGVAMVLFALSGLLQTQGIRLLPHAPSGPRRALARLLARLDGKPRPVRAFVVGLSTTLLPCGWLYAFAMTAAGTGAAWSGAALMAVFWLGSVPLLLAAGLGIAALSARLRAHGPLLASTLLLLTGLATIVVRLDLAGSSARAFGAPAPSATHCPFHPH